MYTNLPRWLDKRTRAILFVQAIIFFWLGMVATERGRGSGIVLMAVDVITAFLVVHRARRLRDVEVQEAIQAAIRHIEGDIEQLQQVVLQDEVLRGQNTERIAHLNRILANLRSQV